VFWRKLGILLSSLIPLLGQCITTLKCSVMKSYNISRIRDIYFLFFLCKKAFWLGNFLLSYCVIIFVISQKVPETIFYVESVSASLGSILHGFKYVLRHFLLFWLHKSCFGIFRSMKCTSWCYLVVLLTPNCCWNQRKSIVFRPDNLVCQILGILSLTLSSKFIGWFFLTTFFKLWLCI
jgi:hypothetical protein